MMPDRILGAVLAGGESRRFGSDKALAAYRGAPMIEHATALLRPFAAEVVIVGGERPGLEAIPDRPQPGLGPLGGVCGALAHARLHGFDAVLTVPCDTPQLPEAAIGALLAAEAPACLAPLPVAGLWRSRDLTALLAHLASGGGHSVRGWAAACGATEVRVDSRFVNVNRPEDLRAAGAD